MKSKRFWIGIAVLTLAAPGLARAADAKVYRKLEVFAKVLSYIDTNYIEDVSDEELIDNGIRGMVSSLDPHTMYMPPNLYRELKEDTSGEFEGVGIELSVKNEALTIVAPIEDSPADRAGIKAGDTILKINGTPTKGMFLLEAVKKLKGPQGSKVTIQLQHKDATEAYEVTLTREKIGIKSVSSELLEPGYGYLRIKSFQEKTDRELTRHLERIEKETGKKELKGIILDLRNNPGGLLEQAIRVADVFLESGVIVSTMGRKGAFQEVKMAHKEGTWKPVPMITLVNVGSASASEIVAGALQDHKRSVILGDQTFGKGSVQTIIDLEDGSALKVTIARYYTPNGRSIQAQGITPDIEVSEVPPPMADTGTLRERDLKGHIEAPAVAKKPDTKKLQAKRGETAVDSDIQLRRAVEYLKTWDVFKPAVSSKNSG
ncbi:MAG: S41 family peptidase [Pseudomonadota bacterium]